MSEDYIHSKIPEGAIGAYSGLYYKIGRFDKLFYWNNEEWVRSEEYPRIIQDKIDKKKNSYSLAS